MSSQLVDDTFRLLVQWKDIDAQYSSIIACVDVRRWPSPRLNLDIRANS